MAEQRAAVHVDLGVQAVQVALVGDHQRVHFDQRQILLFEQLRQAHENFRELVDLLAFQTQLERDLAGLIGLRADQRVDDRFENFLGGFLGDFLDLHAALGGRHEHHPAGGTVEHRAQIQFAGDVGAGFHQNFGDRLAVFIGLERHQALAQPLLGEFRRFLGAVDQFDATGLTAATGVHLGFHDPFVTTDFLCLRRHLFRCIASEARRNRQAVISKKLFRLILVEIHALTSVSLSVDSAPGAISGPLRAPPVSGPAGYLRGPTFCGGVAPRG